MEKLNFEELVNEIYNDGYDEGMCDTVDSIADLYHDACDLVMDILDEKGMTLSETLLVAHALELHADILNDLILGTFDVDVCDCEDCANCPFCDED